MYLFRNPSRRPALRNDGLDAIRIGTRSERMTMRFGIFSGIIDRSEAIIDGMSGQFRF